MEGDTHNNGRWGHNKGYHRHQWKIHVRDSGPNFLTLYCLNLTGTWARELTLKADDPLTCDPHSYSHQQTLNSNFLPKNLFDLFSVSTKAHNPSNATFIEQHILGTNARKQLS